MLAKPFWPVVEYMVNYDYIVNVLCENKDRPEMQCNGKCHLSKELAKEADADEKNPLNSKMAKTEIPQIIIFEDISDFLFASFNAIDTKEKTFYRPIFHAELFTSKILHPPQMG